jgi:hypothetical protein
VLVGAIYTVKYMTRKSTARYASERFPQNKKSGDLLSLLVHYCSWRAFLHTVYCVLRVRMVLNTTSDPCSVTEANVYFKPSLISCVKIVICSFGSASKVGEQYCFA